MSDKLWKKYETKVYKSVKILYPEDKVEHDIKIKGKLSNTKRQIDVSKNKEIPNDFLVYECKDHKRPLDISKVEELYVKLKDVGAKKGAIVSNSPYTKSAKKIAKELGISLYALIDTRDKKILPKIFASVFIKDVFLKSFSFLFRSYDPRSTLALSTSPSQIYLKDSNKKFYSIYSTVRQLWNGEKDFTQKPGHYIYYPTKIKGDIAIWFKKNEKPLIVNNIAFKYEVAKRNHLSKVEIIEANGLLDIHNNSFHAYGTLTTDKITPYEIQMNSMPTNLTVEEAKTTLKLSMISIMPEIPPK